VYRIYWLLVLAIRVLVLFIGSGYPRFGIGYWFWLSALKGNVGICRRKYQMTVFYDLGISVIPVPVPLVFSNEPDIWQVNSGTGIRPDSKQKNAELSGQIAGASLSRDIEILSFSNLPCVAFVFNFSNYSTKYQCR
jgi:hypothetical protein